MRQTSNTPASVTKAIYNKYEMKQRPYISFNIGDEHFDVDVKYRLGADEAEEFVYCVCNGVIDYDTGVYHPERQDYLTRLAVIKLYTNLDLPEDIDHWDLVYGTPVFAMITGCERRPVSFNGKEYDVGGIIDMEQYEQLLLAVQSNIEHLLWQGRINSVIDEIISTIEDAKRAEALERGGRYYVSR